MAINIIKFNDSKGKICVRISLKTCRLNLRDILISIVMLKIHRYGVRETH